MQTLLLEVIAQIIVFTTCYCISRYLDNGYWSTLAAFATLMIINDAGQKNQEIDSVIVCGGMLVGYIHMRYWY
jgi:hypothetical protein